MDCYRLLRSRGLTTPVVILSARQAIAAAQVLGADAGMGKPFNVTDLTELVDRLVMLGDIGSLPAPLPVA